MADRLTFNEGKACDAVLRWIERRSGAQRTDVRLPEQETRDEQAVDVVRAIGDMTFALEHTGIEPFDGLMDLDGRDVTHFKPIRDRLAPLLPQTEHFVIHLQAKATLGLRRRELAKLKDRIVEWAAGLAPTRPIARLDAYWVDTAYPPVPGIPFPIALHRVQRGGAPSTVRMVHLIDRDLETIGCPGSSAPTRTR